MSKRAIKNLKYNCARLKYCTFQQPIINELEELRHYVRGLCLVLLDLHLVSSRSILGASLQYSMDNIILHCLSRPTSLRWRPSLYRNLFSRGSLTKNMCCKLLKLLSSLMESSRASSKDLGVVFYLRRSLVPAGKTILKTWSQCLLR